MTVPQFSHSLPMLLYAAIDVVMPRFRQIFKEFGLTEQQWRILRVLWDIEEVSHSDLARLTLIPAPSLVGIVDRLTKEGLAERNPVETDRRAFLIKITDKGAALMDDMADAHLSWIDALFENVSEADAARAISVMLDLRHKDKR